MDPFLVVFFGLDLFGPAFAHSDPFGYIRIIRMLSAKIFRQKNKLNKIEIVCPNFHEVFDVFASFPELSDVFGPVRSHSDLFGHIQILAVLLDADGCIWMRLADLGKFQIYFICC